MADVGLGSFLNSWFLAGRPHSIGTEALLELWRIYDFPVPTLIPRARSVSFAFITGSGGVIEVLVYETRSGSNVSDRELILAEAF